MRSQKQRKRLQLQTAAVYRLLGSGYFAGPEAVCADIDPSYGSVLLNFYSLDIGVPLSPCMTVGVGYVVSGNLTLSADLALSGHFRTSLW